MRATIFYYFPPFALAFSLTVSLTDITHK